ncbi:MAG: type II toxin-antitoxin system RelE/ParE family toxin [Niastella sp.]|uniref:type II toxin-antitoxin system RelE/ParE family toxin n=1 Tax=Niastella sp. TaxID=1869183 RepID=UPI003899CFF9
MAAKIRWSDNAREDYKNVVDYLLLEWNEEIALRFIEVVEHKIQHIKAHPFTGLRSRGDPEIRNVSITKHNRLYYKITKNLLEIVNIFDTRRHPDKNIYG